MKLKTTSLTILFIMIITPAVSQDITKKVSASDQAVNTEMEARHSIGSTVFMLGNFLPEPPQFYQLNYGYKLTEKDLIIVEAITWTYKTPLGIPYGPSFDSPDEEYPGKIRAYGIGIGYQRFHWKNMYTTIQATSFLQHFLDEDNENIHNGFQLFLQLRFGYRFEFFNDCFFIEPSLVCNYWPVNTNFPEDFEEVEKEWPNYFLPEPGLHFGYKF